MPDAWLLYGLLGLISACLFILTATALVLAQDLRHTLRQINRLVKHSGQVMSGARRIMARADSATSRVTHLVSQACSVAERAVGGLRAKLLGDGNGAGEEPRSRYRR